MVAALSLATLGTAQNLKPGYTLGEKITIVNAGKVSVADLIRADREYPFLNKVARIIKETEVKGRDRSNLQQNPDALPGGSFPLSQNGKSHGLPFTPQTVGANFEGQGATGFYPPDSFGAIGPSQVCTAVNGRINWRSRTGTIQVSINLDTFFNLVGGTSFGTSDPRVTFDPITQKWYVVAITVNSPNRIILAVSNGPTITAQADFTQYYYQVPSAFCDYPSLGVDKYSVMVGENTFNTGLTQYLGTNVTIFPLANLGAGGLITGFRFNTSSSGGQGVDSPRGVDNPDPNAPESYIIGVSNSNFSQLVMRKLSWSGTTPSISGNIIISTPSTSTPINVPTRDTSRLLSSVSDRLFHAQIRKNRKTGIWTLVTAHHFRMTSTGVAGGDRMGMRWYELVDLTQPTPTLRQAGSIVDPGGTPIHYWMGSGVMTGQGHMAFGYSGSNSATYVQGVYSGRLFNDTLGTTRTPTVYFQSTARYIDPFSGVQRWGDYSGTFVDPNDDQTIWTVQEIVRSADTWGVRWAQLLAPAPCPITTVSPNSLQQGQTANVTVTGSSGNGQEYYDTDASYPQRLEAAFSGAGVTVNSISFDHNNPTQVVLNVTVDNGAALGARDLTITNPDRQATVGTGVFTVTAGGGAVAIAPNSFTVRLGRLDSGNVASLANVDGDALKVCKFIVPNQFVEPINVEVNGTAPGNNPTDLKFEMVAKMDTTGAFSQTLDLYDFQTNAFDSNDVRTDSINTTYATRTLTATGNLGRYFSAGNAVRARYRIKQTGPAGASIWCHQADQAKWIYTP
ncbi:MAG: hypothetical protein KF733_04830 [Fimbriimonadaceae bacterium]|nr:MAG: hypothetical protein KF733_04830 [Fimbriimonadaceae bacterium]